MAAGATPTCASTASESQPTTRAHVLVIEDMATVRRLIAALLTQRGFAVTEAEDGAQAMAAVADTAFDVVLLDLELPDVDGLELCRLLRTDDAVSDAYIVIVSGRTEESDRIDGLDAGADDYLVKPFSPEELVLRVQAMLRRPRHRMPDRETPGPEDAINQYSPIEHAEKAAVRLVADSREAIVDGRTVELTHIEFSLLSALVSNIGRVVSRDDLIEACWGASPTDDHHLLSVHVANLRRKIDPDGVMIRTRRGVGYLLADSASIAATTP